MFTTVEQVKEITGYDVDNEVILMAQGVIESVTGRTEPDVTLRRDQLIMARATAYQAAYMLNNYERVFEQVAFINKAYTDGSLTPDRGLMAPFVAPLAAYAIAKCSWYQSRSIRTGTLFGAGSVAAWAVD